MPGLWIKIWLSWWFLSELKFLYQARSWEMNKFSSSMRREARVLSPKGNWLLISWAWCMRISMTVQNSPLLGKTGSQAKGWSLLSTLLTIGPSKNLKNKTLIALDGRKNGNFQPFYQSVLCRFSFMKRGELGLQDTTCLTMEFVSESSPQYSTNTKNKIQ